MSQDKTCASLSVVFTDLHANPKPLRVKCKGLQKDALYEVGKETYTGAALMQGGLVLPKPACNYDSYMVCMKKIK